MKYIKFFVERRISNKSVKQLIESLPELTVVLKNLLAFVKTLPEDKKESFNFYFEALDVIRQFEERLERDIKANHKIRRYINNYIC